MKLDITATTRPDPLGRGGMIQVRLKAVACRDDGTPYDHPTAKDDGVPQRIFVEREAVIQSGGATDAQLAKNLAQGWEAKARGQLAMALAALGLEQPVAATPKTFKVTL